MNTFLKLLINKFIDEFSLFSKSCLNVNNEYNNDNS